MTDEEIKYKNQLWYYKTYNQLVDKALKRGLNKKKLEGYYEKHHILPKCLGGKNRKDNYVLFTYREHVIAHMLLQKIYPDNKELIWAVHMMFRTTTTDGRDTSILSTRTLEYYKILYTESIKGEKSPMYGRSLSKETRKKMSESRKGEKSYMYGKAKSEETKRKISESQKGKYVSEETRKKISVALMQVKISEERRKNISKALKGKKSSDSAKKAISGKNNGLARRVMDPNGIIYDTVKDCAEANGVNRNTLFSWLHGRGKSSNPGYRYLDKTRFIKVIDPNGEVFDSLTKCSEAWSRNKKTIRRWIEKHPEKGFRYYKEEETNH